MKINDRGLAAYGSLRRGIDKEGFLSKKGDVHHGYKRRWFVLKGNLLFYFEKSNDRSPLGLIVLENCSVEVSDADRFSFCIRFACDDQRTYTLCADNDVDMERWMKRITSASYGFLDMLVDEFQKNLRRLRALDVAADAASLDTAALSQEQTHSEILLSKAKPLLDCTTGTTSMQTKDTTDNGSSPKAPPRRPRNSNGASLIRDRVGIVNTAVNNISRKKSKSVSAKTVNRSASSDNILEKEHKERSPTLPRKQQAVKGTLNRVSIPVENATHTTTEILLYDEDDDKSYFELLHTEYGGAIWNRIEKTI